MKVIAFIEGRPKPQPRTTQRAKFLFSKTVDQWIKIDQDNAIKATHGVLNKKGNPVTATRYAYRLDRLLKINEWRQKVFETVGKSCNDGVFTGTDANIPKQFLFIFYLFHSPKSWSKKKAMKSEWQMHTFKPDWKNCYTAIEDAMYTQDSDVNAIANYKMYVPHSVKEGVLIMQNEEIHRFAMDSAIEYLNKSNAG